MKCLYVFFLVLAACDTGERTAAKGLEGDTIQRNDRSTKPPDPVTSSNQRFKEVAITRTAPDSFRVQGKAQIFEARFGWVVEDGHNELAHGSEMTDAGAPAWGNFVFTVSIKKNRPNSTLILILFETSAKDGTRQHELPIVLY
ncbi:MAG: sporulation protein [Sediminibacterium sp.]|nr:sporulation protein [Sediminibacterium sp.]